LVKVSAPDRDRFIARPDPAMAAVLLYGPDPMRTALKRQDLIAALIGPAGEAEMRLARLSAADLRRDPALLQDAMRAAGFFGGQRAVLVDDAGDAVAEAAKAALADWRPGDAMLVLAAGDLKPSSALRKLFEGAKSAGAMPVYADPPGRAEIEDAMRRAGLPPCAPEAQEEVAALAAMLDPGDFRQFLGKLALYAHGADRIGTGDVAAVAPMATDTDLDDVVARLADGRTGEIGVDAARLFAQGSGPVAVIIAATRHFRLLHAIASHPGGPEAGVAAQRPPLFGPRRDRALRQARAWGVAGLERALAVLTDTDLDLRSSRPWPDRALVERALIRVAMMRQQA
jgi:DNA polymerase-3 subunit delta